MAIVIERKFLVNNPPIEGMKKTHIRQGFLSSDPNSVVRVRMCDDGKCSLTVQGEIENNSKQELNFCISSDEAMEMLDNICRTQQIEKTRYFIPYEGDEGLIWEIDIFEGENKGLVLAEIKPESEDQEIVLPEWITEEVSDQAQYRNSNMVAHPYNQWVLEGQEDEIKCTDCNDLGYILEGDVRTPCNCGS